MLRVARRIVRRFLEQLRPVLKGLCDWGSAHEAHVARNGARKVITSPVSKRPPAKADPGNWLIISCHWRGQ